MDDPNVGSGAKTFHHGRLDIEPKEGGHILTILSKWQESVVLTSSRGQFLEFVDEYIDH